MYGQGRRAAETSGPSTLVLSPTKKCVRQISVQSKPVIRDLKGLADFVPYLGYPLLPTLIFSEKNRQFYQ